MWSTSVSQPHRLQAQPSPPGVTGADTLPDCWHSALQSLTAIPQQCMPAGFQQGGPITTQEAQLRGLSSALLAVSKNSATALTQDIGVVVGQWVQHVNDAEGSVHDHMALVLGQ